MSEQKEKQYIYVIGFVDGTFYIGRTKNVEQRMIQHLANPEVEWVKHHKPICNFISWEQKTDDNFEEDKTTLEYMSNYGISNVRGGSFCQLILPAETIKVIEQMIKSKEDLCYKCGQSGHYAKDCGVYEEFAFVCLRCGRDSHDISECYATYHIDGSKISKKKKS